MYILDLSQGRVPCDLGVVPSWNLYTVVHLKSLIGYDQLHIGLMSAKMRDRNVFDVSLLKKYMHDPNHVIDWNVIQVELEGVFQVDLFCILNKKETLLQNQAIG